MLKHAFAILLMVFSLSLSGCVTQTSGLAPFVDSRDGYSFLHPNGWLQKSVVNGPDVVFHDIVEPSENVSVVIGKLKSVKTLEDIGTPQDIGLRIQEKVIGSPNASLISAETYQNNGKPYYLLEYKISSSNKPNESRHDLVSVTANDGNFYTLSISTLESRWLKLKDLFYRVANSFTVNVD
ncbi:PsbP [Synechococcus sp. PCC 7502]|uniref:photosystem II reaction center PsbP n=1 Tax=Synechococcus sp. PCC 7502 TaxID=1173263 RepID=UPI00029FD03A|nr:photosystem II reaction center PsbP [Synechococcus sp. PCC 7502]AFY74586.1 PsbP [Synechococcus sp. PCC 7502]